MPTILIDKAELDRRVGELARELRRDADSGTPPHFVAVLKGAFIFMADLMRAYDAPLTCDFMAVSSYGVGQTSSGEVRMAKDLDQRIEGRDVVLVEDIVDTGITLSYLQQMLRSRGPKSLKTVCLLDKRCRRKVDVPIDYIGFVIEDRFVVGYGLDAGEHHRQLPHIAVLDGPDGA